jgi:AcrR family transcriptional regulator
MNDGAQPEPSWYRFGSLDLSPILDAALSAFTERGYHGASVRDIAARVGVTVPTLYYHHGNKQGLLVALLERSLQDLTRRMDQAARSSPDDPVEQLAALVACTVLFTCHHPNIAWLDAEARYLDEEARRAYVAPREDLERRFLVVIEEGQRRCEFRIDDAAILLRALLGALQSIAVWYRPEGSLPPAAIACRHVDFALASVRADLDASAAAASRLRALLDAESSAS